MNKEISRLETVSDTIEEWLNNEFIVDDALFEALENALVAAYRAQQRAIIRNERSEIAASNALASDWSSEVL